jgi:hypothetical protein
MKRLPAGALLALLLCACAASTPPPGSPFESGLVRAAQWGGTPADASAGKRHAIERITLHHGGVYFDPERDTGQYLRSLQAWARGDRQWLDVPYHYVIDPQGRVYEGRDIAYAGETSTDDYDPAGHALIVVLGNFEREEPSERQLAAAADTMAFLAAKYHVPVERIAGHRDYSGKTACPGRNLARYLEDGWFRRQVAARLEGTGRKP